MGLLMLSTLLDYTYGFSVASPNRKKAKFFLWLGIINNLGILGIFKYYNFFALQFQQGFEFFGLYTNPVLFNIVLPVGISFYTFHGMSYVFDIYRGQQEPVRNFIDYAVFVSFFPLLVAGPIERASHLLPQVQKPRIFDINMAQRGLTLMLWGFFKKVVIADNLAPGVNDIFENYQNADSITLMLGAVYFSFQIYCDFSGYSDIARGLAKLFGFNLLKNFDNPYLSISIPEFWKKWHMSLTGWFRDYLYFPLGGSRGSLFLTIRNTFIIFVVSGFWHGANLTFIFWGLIHALFFLPSLLIKHIFKNSEKSVEGALSLKKQLIGVFSTFVVVSFAWIFFRAPNINAALGYINGIFSNDFAFIEFIGWRSEATDGSHIEFLFILLLFLISWQFYKRLNYYIKNSLLIILIITFGMYFKTADFIYFQF
jgi:alginate O-acetyltransferase complex protein AlgI